MEEIKVFVADERHIKYVDTILDTIERAAKIRGTGIAKRSPEYVKQKMLERKAIIALDGDKFAGFCYIESWSILQRNNRRMCLCTGMLYDPHEHENKDNQELK